MTFTASKIEELQVQLSELLLDFADKHNLVPGELSIRFSDGEFRMKMQFGDMENNPNGINPRWLRDLSRNGSIYNLHPSMVGAEFTMASNKTGLKKYKFAGMRGSLKAVGIDIANENAEPMFFDALAVAHSIQMTKVTARSGMSNVTMCNSDLQDGALE
jgi:hypothetical protein